MHETKLIDGKAIAARLTDALAGHTHMFAQQAQRAPCLAVVLVGEDPASAVYVRNKGRMADRIGYRSIQKTLPVGTSEAQLLSLIGALNSDSDIDGILVQLPLPAHINASRVIELIDPEKDVDGFHPVNVGRLGAGEISRALVPCTPAGSVILARSVHDGDLSGAHAVILGRSNIVGKPAAQLFLAENCTVTIAHSRTRNLAGLTRQADILVAAVGRASFVSADMIAPGATVIDVGINRIAAPELGEGKTRLVGDVDFQAALGRAGAMTPVPGGVGPMTIAMLMANTLTAASRRLGLTEPQLDIRSLA